MYWYWIWKPSIRTPFYDPVFTQCPELRRSWKSGVSSLLQIIHHLATWRDHFPEGILRGRICLSHFIIYWTIWTYFMPFWNIKTPLGLLLTSDRPIIYSSWWISLQVPVMADKVRNSEKRFQHLWARQNRCPKMHLNRGSIVQRFLTFEDHPSFWGHLVFNKCWPTRWTIGLYKHI